MATTPPTAPPLSATPAAPTPPAVTFARRLEDARLLDPLVRAVRPIADFIVADPARRDLLQGRAVGHAVHPPVTDLPIGFWTSAIALDLLGGRAARPAARRLVLLGLLTAPAAATTGWAEFAETGPREQRVGAVHALSNGAAIVGFAASWRARGRGQQTRGVALALASSAAMTLGGFLGGHLSSARQVGSHDPAFDA